MMKMIAVVFACLVAATSAQLIVGGLGDTTWSHESTAQQHSPWAASASTRSQVHGPDAAVVGVSPILTASPIVHHTSLLAAAPIEYAAAPIIHAGAAVPLAYLRR